MQSRIHEMDILRGFAVLGILLYNIYEFGLPGNINSYPTLYVGDHAANLYIWIFNTLFITDTMRGIFAMLFGASAMLLLDDAKIAQQGVKAIDYYYRRNLLLAAFGILHAYILLWPYDVLYAYGLIGLVLFPMRKLSVPILLILGLVMQAYMDVSIEVGGGAQDLLEGDRNKASPQEEYTYDQMRAELAGGIQDETTFYHQGYISIFLTLLPITVTEHTYNFYSNGVFDMGGMMLIGMALFKTGVLTGGKSARFYLVTGILCYMLGIASRGLYAYSMIMEERAGLDIWLIDGADWSFSRVPMSIGHACFMMLMLKSLTIKKLLMPLSAVGRIALTGYLFQTLAAIFIFYGFGLGLYAVFERYELVAVCVGIWLVLIAFCLGWLHFFSQGPLEWLMKCVTHWRLFPLRQVPYQQ